MQLTDVKKKEEIKVNPATYGTVVHVLILAIGAVGFLVTKKLSIKK